MFQGANVAGHPYDIVDRLAGELGFTLGAPAFHEAGHAVMTLCLCGTINDEGVEIDERCNCGSRFPDNALEARERAIVLNALAGWRAEWLHHGRGGALAKAEELRTCLEELRCAEFQGEDALELSDDEEAFREILLRTPDATDNELLVRYARYHKFCLTILTEPAIWAAVKAVAAALLKVGKLSFADVVVAIGGSPSLLSEAAERAFGRDEDRIFATGAIIVSAPDSTGKEQQMSRRSAARRIPDHRPPAPSTSTPRSRTTSNGTGGCGRPATRRRQGGWLHVPPDPEKAEAIAS